MVLGPAGGIEWIGSKGQDAMSDVFYRSIRLSGRHVFWVSSRPLVLHPARAPRRGPCILVANHHSPFDVPVLMRHVPAPIDFVSIVELFRRPILGRFYGAMNAFPLDRSRPDPATVRRLLRRLERGRVVGLFPEGRLRPVAQSVTDGGPVRPSVGRLAVMSGAPVIPCVLLGTAAYHRWAAWIPVRSVRYAINFGEAIRLESGVPADTAAERIEQRMTAAMRSLAQELRADPRCAVTG